MHVNKCIFILTFIFAFLSSNWPFSWYSLSKQKKEVSKSLQKCQLSLCFLSISAVILWVSGILLESQGGHSIEGTALPEQTTSSLYIESGLEIFLDIHKIRRWE